MSAPLLRGMSSLIGGGARLSSFSEGFLGCSVPAIVGLALQGAVYHGLPAKSVQFKQPPVGSPLV